MAARVRRGEFFWTQEFAWAVLSYWCPRLSQQCSQLLGVAWAIPWLFLRFFFDAVATRVYRRAAWGLALGADSGDRRWGRILGIGAGDGSWRFALGADPGDWRWRRIFSLGARKFLSSFLPLCALRAHSDNPPSTPHLHPTPQFHPSPATSTLPPPPPRAC